MMDASSVGRWLLVLCCLVLINGGSTVCRADKPANFINLYGAQMTSNKWREFFSNNEIHEKDSHLLVFALGRRLGRYKDLLSSEVEGQTAKHVGLQEHWELNALATVRWEAFWWDRLVDTSIAYGMGPSYAFDKPRVEIDTDGDTERLLLYWMLELAFELPTEAPLEVLTRIHHRSNGYGYVAESGGSNALALGLRYSF